MKRKYKQICSPYKLQIKGQEQSLYLTHFCCKPISFLWYSQVQIKTIKLVTKNTKIIETGKIHTP
jgi:hypothetical protein